MSGRIITLPKGSIFSYTNKYNDIGKVFVTEKNFETTEETNKKIKLTVHTTGKRTYYDSHCEVSIGNDPDDSNILKVLMWQTIEACMNGYGLKIRNAIETWLNPA